MYIYFADNGDATEAMRGSGLRWSCWLSMAAVRKLAERARPARPGNKKMCR